MLAEISPLSGSKNGGHNPLTRIAGPNSVGKSLQLFSLPRPPTGLHI